METSKKAYQPPPDSGNSEKKTTNPFQKVLVQKKLTNPFKDAVSI